MNRRTFLAVSGGAGLVEPIFRCAPRLRASAGADQVPTNRVARQPVLVRSGFTRKPDGTDERAPSQSGMFDIAVVRSSDSEGRLAVFVFPAGDHTHIAALLFTCITSRMSGYTSWGASSLPK